MRFTTRLTLLFGLVLGVFVISTLPMTAALFRGAVEAPAQRSDWDKVAGLWAGLDDETKQKTAPLMTAVSEWKTNAASTSLEGDARYLRFQTGFLMFSAFQSAVLLVLVGLGLAVLMAPVRKMSLVVARLSDGDSAARLTEGGGTEWKALARQFNSMLDRNQTLSKLQGWQEVAAFLSHQIKNPLTSIAFAEQNVRNLVPELPALAEQNLGIIAEQGRRINNLVRRLRDLTSFEEMTRAEVDFSSWLQSWVQTRKRDGEAWDVSIANSGPVSLIPMLWEQALDNLLANSREAWTGPDPLAVGLRVSGGDLLELVWTDNNRLADGTPLHLVGTARYTTKREGSGLGVFFIRRIAELHGGALSMTLSPRGGLMFTLTLEGGGHGADPRRR